MVEEPIHECPDRLKCQKKIFISGVVHSDPLMQLLKVRTAATDKGFRIRIASTQDRKRFMITVSKNGKIVSKVTESTLDKLLQLPSDVKKDVQKMLLTFSKQKQTRILPPSTTIINKDIPNVGSPGPYMPSAYRPSPICTRTWLSCSYYRNSPTPAGIKPALLYLEKVKYSTLMAMSSRLYLKVQSHFKSLSKKQRTN